MCLFLNLHDVISTTFEQKHIIDLCLAIKVFKVLIIHGLKCLFFLLKKIFNNFNHKDFFIDQMCIIIVISEENN